MDWITLLTEYERERKYIEDLLTDLTNRKQELERDIKKHNDLLKQMRDRVNSAALASGEIKPCEYITIVRRTAWKYDEDEMLAAAKARGQFVRVVESLNKKELNAALDAGEADWAEAIAEKVGEPVVRLDKLGDLLIMAEVAE